jgi:hypothetical protein
MPAEHDPRVTNAAYHPFSKDDGGFPGFAVIPPPAVERAWSPVAVVIDAD